MRSSAIVLAAHSVRRMRAVLVAIALVLGGFQFLLTQVAVFLLKRGGFGVISSFIPDFMQNMAGPSMLAFTSFEGVVAFGYFHPMVLATHVGLAIAIATEPAAEVETRFADLTLARSVARHQVITRTVFVLVWSELVMLLVMMLSTWTGLACCTPADTPRPSAATIRSLAILLGAITLCWRFCTTPARACKRPSTSPSPHSNWIAPIRCGSSAKAAKSGFARCGRKRRRCCARS